MEGSRMRTFLGAGLVLLGGLLLLRALASPVAFVGAPMPAAREIEELTREQQRAQSEIQRAQIEMERAKMEIQRELELAKQEAQANAEVELPPLPPMPALPAMPPQTSPHTLPDEEGWSNIAKDAGRRFAVSDGAHGFPGQEFGGIDFADQVGHGVGQRLERADEHAEGLALTRIFRRHHQRRAAEARQRDGNQHLPFLDAAGERRA